MRPKAMAAIDVRGSSHLELSDLAHGQDNGQPVYKANHGWARDEAHKLCQTQQGCQRLKAGGEGGLQHPMMVCQGGLGDGGGGRPELTWNTLMTHTM